VKVFNTGKLEIPGIKDDIMLDKVLCLLVEILTPFVVFTPNDNSCKVPSILRFIGDKNETVMINSNFSCGYYINREKMYNLLKYKYKINSNYDPCSYPGIQCEFFHNEFSTNIQNGTQSSSASTTADPITKVSFMVFRTGSVLIVGKCTEELLTQIYVFLCNIFENEYDEIKCSGINPVKIKEKTRKLRKKLINT
jgi:hypothetical protein